MIVLQCELPCRLFVNNRMEDDRAHHPPHSWCSPHTQTQLYIIHISVWNCNFKVWVGAETISTNATNKEINTNIQNEIKTPATPLSGQTIVRPELAKRRRRSLIRFTLSVPYVGRCACRPEPPIRLSPRFITRVCQGARGGLFARTFTNIFAFLKLVRLCRQASDLLRIWQNSRWLFKINIYN